MCGNPAASKPISVIFPIAFAFAHFVSLGHVLIILMIFQTLHQQQDYNSLKAQVMVSVFVRNKEFLSEDTYVVFF